jgi:hypothetical protein
MSRWCACDHCSGKAKPVDMRRVAVHEVFGRAALDAMRLAWPPTKENPWPRTEAERDMAKLCGVAAPTKHTEGKP